MKMKTAFPKSLKTGEKFCFKTIEKAVYGEDGLTVADHISQVRQDIGTINHAIDVETARIDNLVAESTDNTINNAELIDIRTGQDSIVYGSAGDAVRGQFLNVFNAIKELTKYTRNAAPESSGIYDSIGTNAAKTELYSGQVIFPYACSVSVPSNYALSVTAYKYDSTNSSYIEVGGVGTSGWVSKYVIPRDVPVAIKLKHSDGSVISKTEFVVLTFTEEYPVAMRNDALSAASFYKSLQYKVAATNDLSISNLSTDILMGEKPLFVRALNGYKCKIIRYDITSDSQFVLFNDYGWADEQFIPAGVAFIFSFKKVDNTLMAYDEFVANFNVDEIQHDDPIIHKLLNSMTGYGINTTDDGGYEATLSTTQLSSLHVGYNEPTTFYIEEQHDSTVLAYNIIENGVITYHSGWSKMITIPANVTVSVLFNNPNARSLMYIKRRSEFQLTTHPFIKDIAQRGFSRYAPENTLVAFEQAALQGFKYVECNVKFTSDNVPVLLRYNTINNTSNGSGDISELTFDEVRTYDFGSWFNSSYTGTLIPSFEEFIKLCRFRGLHPYINFDTISQSNINTLYNIVITYGMLRNVTWTSGDSASLAMVLNKDPGARIGLSVNIDADGSMISTGRINEANELKNDQNSVFITANYAHLDRDQVYLCLSNDIPLEVWDITSASVAKNLHPYVSGFTSDFFQVGRYFLNA